MTGDVVSAALVVLFGLALSGLARRLNTPERNQALARAQQAYDLARHGWAYDVAAYEHGGLLVPIPDQRRGHPASGGGVGCRSKPTLASQRATTSPRRWRSSR